jgi:hypothetical protein
MVNNRADKRRRQTASPSALLALADEFAAADDASDVVAEPEKKKRVPKNQSDRRQTASPSAINALLADFMNEGSSSSSGSSDTKQSPEAVSQAQESGSPQLTASQQTSSNLKGILSARKRPNKKSITKKTVIFGSPDGAEFNFGSPANSMTPMTQQDAKRWFPLDQDTSMNRSDESEQKEEDANTSVNSSILSQWERNGVEDSPAQA